MRADKKKSQDKVVAEMLKDPLATEREIAERAGVSNGTAHARIKEVEQTGAKDHRIVSLTDGDFEIMKTIQKIKKDRLKDPDKVNNKEVDLWENTANKRYTTFRGSVTDEYGGMKMQDPIGDKYLDAMEE